MSVVVYALLGSKALWLLYAWLGTTIVATYLSKRKGYGEKPGLATGLLLPMVSLLIWLVWPARAGSSWKLDGPLGRRRADAGPG